MASKLTKAADLDELRKQHDELLAALKIVEEYLASSPYATDSDEELLRMVRAAIANAERHS